MSDYWLGVAALAFGAATFVVGNLSGRWAERKRAHISPNQDYLSVPRRVLVEMPTDCYRWLKAAVEDEGGQS